jgi:sulfoxide reductase heme-binding subunit YedZ
VSEAIALSRITGWLAIALLVGALAITPIARLGRRPHLAPIRRWLGIATAVAAAGHGAVGIAFYLPSGDRMATLRDVSWLRSGALAVVVLGPLLLTSFPRVVARLRIGLWKPLHRLAYAAALLALHHVLLAPFAPRSWGIGLALVLAVLAVCRLPIAGRARAQEGRPA